MIEGESKVECNLCEVPIRIIKQLIRNNKWKGSLEEEEVMYNLKNNLYSEKYTKKVKEVLNID
jgi:hypothetical protein